MRQNRFAPSLALLFALVCFPVAAQDLSVLQAEVSGDPLSRGYDAMSDQAVFDDLSTTYRSRVVEALDAKTILESIVPTELLALSEANRLFVISFIGASDTHDPRNGSLAFAVFTQLFPNSVTLSNLGAARLEPISRLQELGLEGVRVIHISQVRAQ